MVKSKSPKSESSEDGKHGSSRPTSRWKYLAFAALFAFPAFMYVLDAFLNGFKSLPKVSSISGYIYIISTAAVVVFVWLYFRTHFGSRKYMAVILLPVFLFPSLQVYICSPVVLVNKDIGTTFKLGSTSAEILQYCGEYCLKQFSKSLYSLSLVTPRLTLKVMPSEVVDLNMTTNSLKGGESLKSSRLFLIFSLRSVRGKVHSLSIITRVPIRSTKIVEALKKKQSMELTGKIVNIGSDLKELKGKLERNKLFVRPVVFEPYRTEVNDDDEL